ncbi:Arm DNA-binding domain-containing protein [Polaromonas sp.]|uniref:Arm DNA-binding domain-containing protein n=1 Tax=Polaromonas sp. TaxID=1869339 RepID=UPI003BB80C6E
MPLTAIFTKNAKHSGAPAGDKHTDGGGMYLLVNKAGKYWRMNYTALPTSARPWRWACTRRYRWKKPGQCGALGQVHCAAQGR